MSEAQVVQLPGTGFFTDKGALVVPQLAEVIKDAGNVRTGVDGRLYRYDHGVYLPDGEVFARARVRELLGDRCQRKYFDEVLSWLRSFEPTVTAKPATSMLNVGNGLLDWRSGELHSHDPAVVSTVQSPVSWAPSSGCPAIERFLAEVLPADAIELIYEVAGYVLYPGNPLRRAVLFLGPGRNGKSVLLGILRALVGEANVSAVPLQALAENRFAAAELFGKLANISGDLDARAIKNTDIFKMATGNDPIQAERKYGAAFSFVAFATFVFAANESPVSSDQTDAWFDRWLVVPFDRRVPDERVDPQLLTRLTTAGELSGLLVKAVSGLRRLMARGRFALPPSVDAAGAQYRDKLDTVRGFVAESCTVHPDAWVPRPVLYRQYRQWATDSGRLPVSVEKFNEHLRQAYPVTETTRRGVRGWAGIALGAPEEGP
jgi:P4 family phage/plasmid primase-like protien